ncbi:SRPBCC family protein [Thalassobellus citreus]|uniref:SRPBCC family protein n=1 Tax=Thalassobellus citreus TaxID=3367752 RepID=UPI0037A3A6C5
MKNLKHIITLAGIIFTVYTTSAQKKMKLATIHSEQIVNVSPEEAWKVINSYGNVGTYHSAIASSKPINGSNVEGSLGCERQCYILNGKKEIFVDEKIIDFVNNSYYKYTASSEQFPAKAFFNTFGVKQNEEGKTVIYVTTEYKLKPWFLTWMAKGKLRKGNEDALLFYKHYMETGEKNADPKTIKKKYKNA